jgi:hypothetical protein
MVANAVAASATPTGELAYLGWRMPLVRVSLMSDGLQVLVKVHDQATGVPVVQDAGPDAEAGRGLHLIDALARGQWGWYTKKPQLGKCVWAVLAQDRGSLPRRMALTPVPLRSAALRERGQTKTPAKPPPSPPAPTE